MADNDFYDHASGEGRGEDADRIRKNVPVNRREERPKPPAPVHVQPAVPGEIPDPGDDVLMDYARRLSAETGLIYIIRGSTIFEVTSKENIKINLKNNGLRDIVARDAKMVKFTPDGKKHT